MSFPALHGNWVDLLIILFVSFYVWDSWGKGFITLVFELGAFVGSFVAALKFYPVVARLLVDNFSIPRGIANAAGFFVLGIVVEQLLSYALGLLHDRLPPKLHKHKLNLYLSLIPLIGNAVVIVAFVLTLILGLPIAGRVKAAISDSKIGSPIVLRTQRIERKLASIFGEALADSFNFITIGPVGSKEEVKLNFTQRELNIDEATEADMLNRVNQERISRGLSTLKMDPKLRDLAREYARDMFERGYFSHYNPEGQSPFDRMEEVGISYRTAGENLALAPNVSIAHQGLMESKGHRENILNPEFGRVGIGVIDGGIYGKMFVQEFMD